MLQALSAIGPIVLALLIGACLGKKLPYTLNVRLSSFMMPVIIGLMVATGYRFGALLNKENDSLHLIQDGILFAALFTFASAIAVVILYIGKQKKQAKITSGLQLNLLFSTLWEISRVLLCLIAGGLLNFWLLADYSVVPVDLLVDILLYLLVAIVGVELSMMPFREHIKHLDGRALSLPLMVILASWGSASVYALVMDLPLQHMLALASGFGWFTLSGVMIEQQLGETMGLTALFTDLFREIFAIIMIVMIGRQHYASSVGASAAAAMDSTLPFIRASCHPEAIPIALYSGTLLSLCCPIMISFFLAL